MFVKIFISFKKHFGLSGTSWSNLTWYMNKLINERKVNKVIHTPLRVLLVLRSGLWLMGVRGTLPELLSSPCSRYWGGITCNTHTHTHTHTHTQHEHQSETGPMCGVLFVVFSGPAGRRGPGLWPHGGSPTEGRCWSRPGSPGPAPPPGSGASPPPGTDPAPTAPTPQSPEANKQISTWSFRQTTKWVHASVSWFYWLISAYHRSAVLVFMLSIFIIFK